MACEMCEAAGRIEAGEDVHAVARLSTGYVKLLPTQYYRGYTLFSANYACARFMICLRTLARRTSTRWPRSDTPWFAPSSRES